MAAARSLINDSPATRSSDPTLFSNVVARLISTPDLMIIIRIFKLNLHIQEMVFERSNSIKGNHKSFKEGYHIRTPFNVSPNRHIKEISNQRTQITFNFLNKEFSYKRIKKVTRNHAPHRCPTRK
ncbi:hypothetical protein M9H77_03025 [Catharanthus roseus]|uniref:Uncharacterized protein n=1 Tax=Catharanthus roseus TaxID=4058 RepID=A0ACC0CA84_CATRO|nr:hypothetical protein M9H77_03025 [Catharanthus roseus]